MTRNVAYTQAPYSRHLGGFRWKMVLLMPLFAMAMGSPAVAQLVPRHRPIALDGNLLADGRAVNAIGIIRERTGRRGCFIVQLQAATGPVVACTSVPTHLRVAQRIRVRGRVEGTLRARSGVFLDFLPRINGSISYIGSRR